MRDYEVLRYKNTVNDLLDLGVNDYCDLDQAEERFYRA